MTGIPRSLKVLAGAAVLAVSLPVAALLWRVPWASAIEVMADPVVRTALRLSLLTSAGSLFLGTILGVPLAVVLARCRFPGRRLVRAVVVLPMVLPPVVAGVALLLAFGRRGVVGGPAFDAFGVSVPFTTWAVILAGTFVAMPFLVVTLEAGVRSADARLEEAAATLGASAWFRLRHVTLPLVTPSLRAGMALCWARALGEFGATLTFAGNLPGRTQTMPLGVYLELESNPPAAYVMSVVLLAVSAAVLVAMRERYLGAR